MTYAETAASSDHTFGGRTPFPLGSDLAPGVAHSETPGRRASS